VFQKKTQKTSCSDEEAKLKTLIDFNDAMAEVRLLGWWFMPKEVGLLVMGFVVFYRSQNIHQPYIDL
jgi:hypothetical protein